MGDGNVWSVKEQAACAPPLVGSGPFRRGSVRPFDNLSVRFRRQLCRNPLRHLIGNLWHGHRPPPIVSFQGHRTDLRRKS